MKPIIMLPTYNERDNIEIAAKSVLKNVLDLDILIIDDSSPDGTGEIADRLAREFPRVKVMHRPPKSGRGTASRDGYRYAIENGYTHYLEFDVDGSHRAEEIPALIARAGDGADLVIGSRYMKGGSVGQWSLQRRVLHFLADLYVNIVLGTPTTDHTNGLRCYSVEMLKKINFNELPSEGYVAHSILENVIYRAGFRIDEVPSAFKSRTVGQSKNSIKEAINGVLDILKYRTKLIKIGIQGFKK
jgi:dolichol-phosphate mannosyltransferase